MANERRGRPRASAPRGRAAAGGKTGDGKTGDGRRRQTLIIPIKPPTANAFYAGGHWSKRKRLKDRWLDIAQVYAREQQLGKVERYPVHITVRLTFGKGQTRYDAGNVHGAEKLLTDALVKIGILDGDSPRYVDTVQLGPCERGLRTCIYYTITEAR